MASLTSFRSQRLLAFSIFLAVSGVSHAEEMPRGLTPTEREPFADQYLRERLAHWQRRLQLQGWTISVVMTHPERLRPATLGNIRWDPDNKTATIRVLHAAQYRKPFEAALKDMEFTLVHELIHLTLSPLPRNEASRSEEERAINRLAHALLERDLVD
jgi:hypothetical protein